MKSKHVNRDLDPKVPFLSLKPFFNQRKVSSLICVVRKVDHKFRRIPQFAQCHAQNFTHIFRGSYHPL